MKKLLAILLSIAMLACGVVVASAEGTVTATLDVVKGVKAGDAVDINIVLSDVANGYAEINISDIEYDDTVLEYKGIKAGSFSSAYMAAAGETFAIIGAPEWEEDVLLGGTVATLKFTALADVTELSEVTAAVTVAVYTDGTWVENEAAEVTVVAGGVDVAEVIPESSETVEPPASSGTETPSTGETESKVETPAGTDSKVDKPATSVPKTADNSVVLFAAIVCVAMAAAFVITKKVND